MKKRGIALLLSLIMTSSVIAGCGSSADTDKGTVSTTTTGSASEVTAETGELTLPLTDKTETITVWMTNDTTAMAKNGGDYNNNPYYQELEADFVVFYAAVADMNEAYTWGVADLKPFADGDNVPEIFRTHNDGGSFKSNLLHILYSSFVNSLSIVLSGGATASFIIFFIVSLPSNVSL